MKGNYKDYIILDGDDIKDNLLPELKSVDCIIISKKAYDGDKIDVIICELGGDKKWADVKKKDNRFLRTFYWSNRQFKF